MKNGNIARTRRRQQNVLLNAVAKSINSCMKFNVFKKSNLDIMISKLNHNPRIFQRQKYIINLETKK